MAHLHNLQLDVAVKKSKGRRNYPQALSGGEKLSPLHWHVWLAMELVEEYDRVVTFILQILQIVFGIYNQNLYPLFDKFNA